MSKRIVIAAVAFVALAGLGMGSVKMAHAYMCTTNCYGNSCTTTCY